jgi:hypothetical protein
MCWGREEALTLEYRTSRTPDGLGRWEVIAEGEGLLAIQ